MSYSRYERKRTLHEAHLAQVQQQLGYTPAPEPPLRRPWWVPLVIVLGALAPIAIVWHITIAYGAVPGFLAGVATASVSISQKTERKYLDGRPQFVPPAPLRRNG